MPAGWVPSGDYRYQIGFNDGTEGFCGTHAISDNAQIMCGPAPGRLYTGVTDKADEVNIDEYCDVAGTNPMTVDCTVRFNSTLLATKLTMGTAMTSMGMTTYTLNPGMGEVNSDVDINEFRAGAVADLLGEEDANKLDTWSIDEEKNLINENNGLEF